MKMKLTDYADTLIDVLGEKTDLSLVAKNFWKILQRNGQIKELPKVLELLDEAYAKKNNMSVAYVTSNETLSEETREMIIKNIESKSKNKILLKEKVNSELLAGIIVRFSGEEYNFSVQNQIFKLKQHLV